MTVYHTFGRPVKRPFYSLSFASALRIYNKATLNQLWKSLTFYAIKTNGFFKSVISLHRLSLTGMYLTVSRQLIDLVISTESELCPALVVDPSESVATVVLIL